MVELIWHAHMPGVALDLNQKESYDVGVGYLTPLSFDEWMKLDPQFRYFESKYERSQPVFYVGVTDFFTDDYELIKDIIIGFIWTLYTAMLLHPNAPILPSPLLSGIYIRDGTKGVRFFGPFEREWILYGHRKALNRVSFSVRDIEVIQQIYNLLDTVEYDKIYSGLELCLSTLAWTAHPEFWFFKGRINPLNEFLHCMIALENLIMPTPSEMKQLGKDLTLTEVFGQNITVLMSPSRDDLKERAKFFSEFYTLRSKIIHGELGVEIMDDPGYIQKFLSGRRLLRDVFVRLLLILQAGNYEKNLPLWLCKAYKDSKHHSQLLQYLNKESI